MLEGIRIIEIEGLGPGPFAAMTFADLGADVVTIHRKDVAGAPVAAERNLLDRGKRSIVLDLKDHEDIVTARSLIATVHGHCSYVVSGTFALLDEPDPVIRTDG